VTGYVDSSALVAVYVPERFSGAARSVARDLEQVPFTTIHGLEMFNTFEWLVGRGLITRDECRAVQAQVQDDLDKQRLVSVSLDLEGVFSEARDLSRRHGARTLARSLDLLHVAAAHLGQCTTFVSADDRQLAVAKASGLTPVDIKRGARRRRS
jgi:predicted nucleic acid-binding protein